ncbi:MAG: hypothetical protein B6229_10345 [Spirochaetaceae bacterium 4572_7]|nr:MAG: hypothetical protein B6229_10345 [Spirochaetaceae bacterium 4572_7]
MERYNLRIGYIYVTDKPCIISTILGSCVSVCIYDIATGLSGMNHYLLSKSGNQERSTRYGDISIHKMYKIFMDSGSKISNLRAYVIGGTSFLSNNSIFSISQDNVDVAINLLNMFQIKVLQQNTGGKVGRKVEFNTVTNKVEVIVLDAIESSRLQVDEAEEWKK